MGVKIKRGNLFTTECQTLVNTVNCVGVMGAGIALEFRLRYPAMFEKYVTLCDQGLIEIGQLWIYKGGDRWVLNFPTKKHWKYPTKEEFLRAGLEKFKETYREKGIESIAFPLLGAQNGGLEPARSEAIMLEYLSQCEIPIEIYHHDPNAPDDLLDGLKTALRGIPDASIRKATGLAPNQMTKVREFVSDPKVHQLNQLTKVKGIGMSTLEKVFSLARDQRGEPRAIQESFLG